MKYLALLFFITIIFFGVVYFYYQDDKKLISPISSNVAINNSKQRSILKIKLDELIIPSDSDVFNHLTASLERQEKIIKNYTLGHIKETASIDIYLYDKDFKKIIKLKPGINIDVFGQPINGWQSVAVYISDKIFTGLIKSEVLTPIMDIDKNLTDNFPDVTSKLKLSNQDLKFIVIDNNETSPILRFLYDDFNQRKIMMATVEDLFQLLDNVNFNLSDTILVNKKMLDLYYKENREELIEKIVIHETEHLKQQTIIKANSPIMTLDLLFWEGKDTTISQKLLEALADARLDLNTTKRYKGKIILTNVDQKYAQNSPYYRLSNIYFIYKELMEQLDKKESIESNQAKEFVSLLKELNKNPTEEEMDLFN